MEMGDLVVRQCLSCVGKPGGASETVRRRRRDDDDDDDDDDDGTVELYRRHAAGFRSGARRLSSSSVKGVVMTDLLRPKASFGQRHEGRSGSAHRYAFGRSTKHQEGAASSSSPCPPCCCCCCCCCIQRRGGRDIIVVFNNASKTRSIFSIF